MTKLQQVRAKIIEANPSILELKFGCHVLYESHNQKHEAIINGINQATTDSKSLMRKYGCHSTIDSFSVDTFTTTHNYPYVTDALTYAKYKEIMEHTVPIKQILGRPIHLLDCAKALNRDITELIKLWNDEDDLDRQSEACIELLYSKLFT